MKTKGLFLLIIFISLFSYTKANIIEIKVKIQNEIITNVDIENEKKYLIFLNPKLEKLDNLRLINIAKDSLITEIIKKNELKKFFNFEKENNFIDVIEENLLRQKKIENKSEFIKILKNKNLNYKNIKEKLKIEALWNQLIYNKNINNVKIDQKKLKQKIINDVEKNKKKYEYNLSEIVIVENINENFNNTIRKITKNINEIGFENTANLFSLSNTAKNGGLIGWVNELQLSKKILSKINDLKIGQISNPIKIQSGYLILKVNNKKEFRQKINIEDQIKDLIDKETNRQLNSFSIVFYKRLKKNVEIYEY